MRRNVRGDERRLHLLQLKIPTIGDTRRDVLISSLVSWFDLNARELPWRAVEDPYAVWVSEIMLQQTQVSTVIDYFERWMQTFPDVDSLACAELDDVLALWQGLGYYRRARYLHRGAKMVVDEFDGRLPGTGKELKRIPGIGPYTAGAIASIAFDEPEPIVDGNVIRVLSRLFALDVQPKERAHQKVIWALAEELVPDSRPGDFNQSLMELGATVCTPQNPNCLVCPVQSHCEGFATGEPTRFPRVARRGKVRKASAHAAIIIDPQGMVLVEQRPASGLLAGLWQFPSVDDGELDDLRDKLAVIGFEASDQEAIGEVSHRFSHIDMTITIWRFEVATTGVVNLESTMQWVSWEGLGEIAVSAAMRKVEEVARAHIG